MNEPWWNAYTPVDTEPSNGELFPDVLIWEKANDAAEHNYFLSQLKTYEHPVNDNERLSNLQAEFLRTGSKMAECKLWTKCLEIAGKLITIERKQKGFYLDPEMMEDKKLEAVEYMLRRYKKRYQNKRNKGKLITQYYSIDKSFMCAIQKSVEHALYYEDGQKAKANNVKIVYVGDLFDTLQYKEQINEI